ncbi:hypothetical protein ACFQZ2_04670, partial [Streptomonospora algeriensis]
MAAALENRRPETRPRSSSCFRRTEFNEGYVWMPPFPPPLRPFPPQPAIRLRARLRSRTRRRSRSSASARPSRGDGRDTEPGGEGEIRARGPMSVLCCVNAPELDARYRAEGGWVRSG